MQEQSSRGEVLVRVSSSVSERFPFIGKLVQDQIVSSTELHLLESLVLGCKQASVAERQVLGMIFRHADRWEYPEPLREDMARFRQNYGV